MEQEQEEQDSVESWTAGAEAGVRRESGGRAVAVAHWHVSDGP